MSETVLSRIANFHVMHARKYTRDEAVFAYVSYLNGKIESTKSIYQICFGVSFTLIVLILIITIGGF